MPTPRVDPDHGADGSIEPQLLDLLRDATGYADAIGEAALADTSLSLSSSGLLVAICQQPGITIAQISRQIPKTQQTIGQVVARLQKLELIDRRIGEGRGIALYPTDRGRELAGLAIAREIEIEHRLREILGARRHARLTALLVEARAALHEAIDAQQPPAR